MRHSVDRPSSRSRSRWFRTIELVRANQNADSPARTRPLSGISVGSTTSNVEMRSLATSSSRSSSSRYSSRTFPLPTCAGASGMDGSAADERTQAVERRVDVTNGRLQVEDSLEALGVEAGRDLRIGAHQLREVALLVPRAHRVSLHEPVCLVTLEA